jgi:hypothetical protein
MQFKRPYLMCQEQLHSFGFSVEKQLALWPEFKDSQLSLHQLKRCWSEPELC